jgi:hypothetical protein
VNVHHAIYNAVPLHNPRNKITKDINDLEPVLKAARSKARTLSSAARTLGSWVRIPLEAWMDVRVFLCSCCPV